MAEAPQLAAVLLLCRFLQERSMAVRSQQAVRADTARVLNCLSTAHADIQNPPNSDGQEAHTVSAPNRRVCAGVARWHPHCQHFIESPWPAALPLHLEACYSSVLLPSKFMTALLLAHRTRAGRPDTTSTQFETMFVLLASKGVLGGAQY